MSKRRVSALFALALCTAVFVQSAAQEAARPESQPDRAMIDKPVKDFKLKDLMKKLKDGEKEDAAFVSLSQFKDKKAVALFFMSEKCGTTWQYEKRFGKLLEKYADSKDVALFGVRCSANDTPEGLCKFAEAKNFDMPLLNDEKGEMTRYFKVRATPTFVVVDKKGVLRYFGSFDDNANEASAKQAYLPDALEAVLTDKEVKVKETRAFG
jgi:peroxiredoxin